MSMDKLDLERQASDEIIAFDEEQKNADYNFNTVDNEIDKLQNNMPYPDILRYDTGYDYDNISDLKYKKAKNRPFYDKIKDLEVYSTHPHLYVGHIRTHNGLDYYLMDLDLKEMTIDEKTKLISVNDKKYLSYIRGWRFPDKEPSISFSRNIIINSREIKNVDVILDRNSTEFSEISDSFLRKALIRNKSNDNIKSIIQTIQEKQDFIRSLSLLTPFIVQGCAGSGKTMVLLHRIRYLLYNNLMHSDEYLLIVPSLKFKKFITSLAQEFGISPKNIIPFKDYYITALKLGVQNVDNDQEVNLDSNFLAMVYSRDFVRECFAALLSSIKSQIDYLVYLISNKPDIVANHDDLEKINTLLAQMDYNIKDSVSSISPISDYYIGLVDLCAKLYSSIKIEDYYSKREASTIKKRLRLFETKSEELPTYFTNLLVKICTSKIKNDCKINAKNEKNYKFFCYLKLYFHYLCNNLNCNRVKYIFIDETQDLSVSEIELIYKINATSSGKHEKSPLIMNLFGDINQNITTYGLSQWKDLTIGSINKEIYYLDENFRNTNEIIDYCNDIFPFTMKKLGVNIKPVSTYTDLDSIFSNIPDGAVFIVKNEETREKLITEIEEIEEYNDHILHDYEILTVKESKGLEFRETFVFDEDMTSNEKYVAYTRALTSLNVIEQISFDWSYY